MNRFQQMGNDLLTASQMVSSRHEKVVLVYRSSWNEHGRTASLVWCCSSPWCGGAGMDYSAMLSQLNRVPGGMSPGPMGRPTGMRPGLIVFFRKEAVQRRLAEDLLGQGYAKRHNRK